MPGFLMILILLIFSNQLSSSKESLEDENEDNNITYGILCEPLQKAGKEKPIALYTDCAPFIFGLATRLTKISNADILNSKLLDRPKQREKTTINFRGVTLISFGVDNDYDYQPDMQLQFLLDWHDRRLSWNSETWNFSEYPTELKPIENIWAPGIELQNANSQMTLKGTLSYYNTVITNEGRVNTSAMGQMIFQQCSIDSTNYPDDILQCCAKMVLDPKDYVKVVVDGDLNSWDTISPSLWKISSITLNTQNQPNMLKVCINAQRNGGSLKIEMKISAGISASVLLCSQLAHGWKNQLYFKLFAILIQMVTFQNVANNLAMTGAIRMPKIHSFYHFTTIMTVITLLQTMILWALSRRWFLAPPPYNLTLMCKVCGKVFLGKQKNQSDSDTLNVSERNSSIDNNKREWQFVFTTISVMLSIVFVFAYVFGVLIIFVRQ